MGLPSGLDLKATLRITGTSIPNFISFLDSVGLVTEMKHTGRGIPIIGYVTSSEDGRMVGKIIPANPVVPVTVELMADQVSTEDFEKIMAMIEALSG